MIKKWKVDGPNPSNGWCHIVTDEDESETIAMTFKQGQKNNLANACLMAKSQELLEQLEIMTGMVEEMLKKSGPCGWGMIAVDNAREVILEAKGNEQ